MARISNPHDEFCRYLLNRPEQAAGFLAHFLPPGLLSPLRLSKLTPLPGTFVDDDLTDHHTDLLFSVPGKHGPETLVYILFEHKSTPDRRTPLQLYRYMERVWNAHLKRKKSLPLPSILPVLVYQGRKPWPWPTQFEDLVQPAPGYERFVPKFSFHLVDLSLADDASLPSDPMLGVGILIMKHVRHPDLPTVIRTASIHFAALPGYPDGLSGAHDMTDLCST